MASAFKIPQSVLVVIHTTRLLVLLIKRSDSAEFWQSVTGSKDRAAETWRATAVREVQEETGIDCANGTALQPCLRDWQLENVYTIYPRWLHRYAPGITHNTEHLFGLCVPADTPVRLKKGEEMGRFLLGSTVVLLFPKGACRFNPSWAPERSVRLGEAMSS